MSLPPDSLSKLAHTQSSLGCLAGVCACWVDKPIVHPIQSNYISYQQLENRPPLPATTAIPR